MVISHRGVNEKGLRENSISSFEEALNRGAEGIECDVSTTKDQKIIISHDEFINGGKKIKTKNYKFDELRSLSEFKDKYPLDLNELFAYIVKKQRVSFYIEIKNGSRFVIKQLIEKISKDNLWDRVYLLGLPWRLKYALKIQNNYPKLKLYQLLIFPLASFVKKPKKSYGLSVGWIDNYMNSERFFKSLISERRLLKLKELFINRGFQVMGGVINNEQDLKMFIKAGIVDIVSDNIEVARKTFDIE